MNMKRYGMIFLGCLLVMNFMCLPGVQAVEKTITVGLSLVYTGSSAPNGSSTSNGVLDHLMWINNQGGIEYRDPGTGKLERIKMKIVWEDNAYNASRGMSVYKRLRAAGAQVIFGYGSPGMEVISSSLSRDRIPGICMYGYATPAGYRPQPRYYAATSGTPIEAFATPVKWFLSTWKERRPPKIGLIISEIPSWRILGDPEGAKAQVEKMGGIWLGAEWVPLVVTDLSVPISRMMKKEADLICSMGGISQTIVLAKDLSRLGVDLKKVRVICSSSSWDESILKIVPREAEGLYGEIRSATIEENFPGVKLSKEIAHWRGRTPEQVNNTYMPGVAAGYLMKAGLKAALEKVGADKLTPTDIRDALFSLKDVDVGGLMPKVTVENPEFPTYMDYIRYSRIEGGKFKIVSNWFKRAEVQYGRK